MEFNYKNNNYMVAELKEPNDRASYDIASVFKMHYFLEKGLNETDEEIDEDTFLKLENGNQFVYVKYEFVDYFYGVQCYDEDELIMFAKESIDRFEEKKGSVEVI